MGTTHINKTHTAKGLWVKLCLTNLTIVVKHKLTIVVKHTRKIVNQCLTIIVRFLTNIVNLCLTNVVNLCLTIIVKFVKHNFTHMLFGVWVLLMWVVPIQDNISLNYNPLFQGKTLWYQLCRLFTWVYLFFMFKGIYVFIYLWLHLIIYLGCLRTLGGDQATS